MFLSVVLWFVLDSQKSPAVLVDHNKVYAVIDVTMDEQPALNQDCESEDTHEHEGEYASREDSMRYSGVARRMIEQFFTEIEGPDRDWRDTEYEIYEDENP